jgi:hypothetical protein
VIDPDVVNPNYNRSGLNGLTTGSTSGLQTVSGKCRGMGVSCCHSMCICSPAGWFVSCILGWH